MLYSQKELEVFDFLRKEITEKVKVNLTYEIKG